VVDIAEVEEAPFDMDKPEPWPTDEHELPLLSPNTVIHGESANLLAAIDDGDALGIDIASQNMLLGVNEPFVIKNFTVQIRKKFEKFLCFFLLIMQFIELKMAKKIPFVVKSYRTVR